MCTAVSGRNFKISFALLASLMSEHESGSVIISCHVPLRSKLAAWDWKRWSQWNSLCHGAGFMVKFDLYLRDIKKIFPQEPVGLVGRNSYRNGQDTWSEFLREGAAVELSVVSHLTCILESGHLKREHYLKTHLYHKNTKVMMKYLKTFPLCILTQCTVGFIYSEMLYFQTN